MNAVTCHFGQFAPRCTLGSDLCGPAMTRCTLKLTCRCSSVTSALWVAALLLGGGALVAELGGTGTHRITVPSDPEPCGVWPHYFPCYHCAYGTMRPPHRVTAGDTCVSLAATYGVPQFDLFNRNRSVSCCKQPNISVSDMIDFCAPPSVDQWRKAGHPRQLPSAGKMVATYVGTKTVKVQGMPGRFALGSAETGGLPYTVNVAFLGGVEDITSTVGDFSIGVARGSCGCLPDNCTAQIDPRHEWDRGSGQEGDEDTNRVWIGSLLPLEGCGIKQQCNWDNKITAEDWGSNAALSLKKIILRYRLDGLDFNIEHQRKNNFGAYLCSLFRHLGNEMGPGLIYTLTPCCGLESMYREVAMQCGQNVSLIQAQTYNQNPTNENGEWLKFARQTLGWSKSSWSVGTKRGGYPSPPQRLWDTVKHFYTVHPESPGIFTWTAESSYSCRPKFCVERIVAAAQQLDNPNHESDLFNCQC